MKYGSVCSGIEAASKAWEPLGWKPAWFSEIEPFPSAVLAHHWPEVSNLGDMTKIVDAVRTGDVEAPDVLVGGTPCQAFSIAGLREGLSDDRGQLTLSYVELANAIDAKRRERGEPEAIIVWENVPGVLSSKDNAFGCFLAGLAGESSELQPAGGKWTHAGCVSGPERVIAWRVLDAQFFGVAQRRRRVFVVASARKGFDPAAVLFELDSVRRDSAPRRETQKAVAALTARGVGTCGADDNQAQAGHLIAFGGGNTAGHIDVATACTAHGIRLDFDTETFAVHGTQDPDTNCELAHTLGRNNGQENACIAFSYKDNGADATSDLSPTIRAGNHDKSHANSGQPPAIAYAFKAGQGAKAGGIGYAEEQSPTLTSASSGTNLAPAVMHGVAVRRLTPIECERLQGFPDNHTLIGWRGKDADECPDGPHYKAIGNSMAVPVMRWIGERIAAALPIEEPTPRNWQRPFLKWAGGKYSLLPELDRLIPAGKRLVEPFVGGGSVFLNSEKHESFLLADVNADLINLYQMLEVDHIRVCSLAKILFERANSEVAYKELRDEFNNQRMGAPERAAAFLFLNRHCFNGLIRYNRDGFFNVGWGKYEAPYFPEIEIKAFKQKSHKCVFLNAGYRRTLALAGEGDVVYCDPPYEPLTGTAGFTNYAAGGFSWADQISLAESCVAAHQRGAKVLISNSTAPRVLELYEQHGFILHHVDARRAISSKGSTRETAKDIVATLGV
ncbi:MULTISPECIES: Dam family site-specific DNA-(adenine-N6)-methyltransferase [Enterobacter cloacae complex]|uniref:Dam family site-specific DNA-(adenine-N6)-methyltransferase n=1 Tax=Enterobacter cloacae complex TaxID=354276 RepID=UPI0014192C1E|nr:MULTISPECIES: Dam family site-specific DNA-(adenine-N6)-methyltransferase [Enterobacter cloacae complex]MCM7929983.1 Dam family site-specific DNA-(adenine-N6)-methyltransferase [Enterobacter hormaechei]MCM7965396.1 Dam family site-specific DNA-(adenine-N6)-methyltransferase [Enterobacter hormaechei]MCM7968852.1 Dam family site-specific DNA-(adenine-N6)-methyltransferase [Enterobacter hormaechei]MCM7975843.1 Dam family site-specific DNA-(adenine-N6)-methyltransferase [Enterobacter hormaechei]